MCLFFGAHKNFMCFFKSFASRLKSGGYSSKPLVIFFFNLVPFFLKTKIGQLSVTGLSYEKQSIESANNCFICISLGSLSVFLFGHSKHSSVYMLV